MRVVERALKDLGMEVRTNVVVGGVELDLVAVEYSCARPLVYVIEAKSRPKRKLVEQVLARVEVSDYVYVALPAKHYPYLSELPDSVGLLAVDPSSQMIYEVRQAKFVGNGWKLLELLGSRPPRDDQLSTQALRRLISDGRGYLLSETSTPGRPRA